MSATFTSRVACSLTSLVVLFAAYASSVPAGFDTFDLSSVVGGVNCTHVYIPLAETGQCGSTDMQHPCAQFYDKCKTSQGLFRTICTEESGDNGCGISPLCVPHADANASSDCTEVGT